LYVAEAARGAGVGTLLLKTVAAIAHGEGCKRFNWQALDWNTPALDFYKALGAARMDSWVNLRVGKAELPRLLGLS
jgi:GNAT superfamily N-acetyltransferase